MANLEIYRNKFADSGWQIFERAIAEARRREQNYVRMEHVVFALAQEKAELFTSLVGSLAEKPDAFALLLELIEKRLQTAPKYEGEGIRLATEVIALFKLTHSQVRSNLRQRMEATDLFITLLMNEKSLLRELLNELLADPRALAKPVRDLVTIVESVGAASRPSPQQTYKFLAGEMVRIKSGAFASFNGAIEKVQEESSTLQVAVFILGREQPVELRFMDVEKLKTFE